MDASVVRSFLSRTRELFATTHWTTGAFGRWDEQNGKATFCAVGGLRYIGMGLTEQNFRDVDECRPDSAFTEYFEAARAARARDRQPELSRLVSGRDLRHGARR